MSDYIECGGCKKFLKKTTSGKYRKHKDDRVDEVCDYSGTVVPKETECESTPPTATSRAAESAESSKDDAREPASSATPSTGSSLSSPEPGGDASTASAQSAPPLPGSTEYATELGSLAETQLAKYKAELEAGLTPFSQPADHYEVEQPTLFSQPAGAKSEAPVIEMGDLGKELTARLKEIFYAWDNRRSSDNRSAQVTMGPSEMGTPCDRRLALSIMRMPPVNPGGDGWAAFVGTCIHAGLEQMFMWADAGSGRFAVEQRLEFDHPIVPKGTADLIDRTLFMLDDHKCQGRWSRNKLKTQGPSKTYRVQAHVYAKGARMRGERIDYIAIISWPRDEATLDDLYVFTEPYNPAIADAAFERVDRIAAAVDRMRSEVQETYPITVEPSEELELEIGARVAADFDVADDCRFCKYYLPGARSITQGCNGKR